MTTDSPSDGSHPDAPVETAATLPARYGRSGLIALAFGVALGVGGFVGGFAIGESNTLIGETQQAEILKRVLGLSDSELYHRGIAKALLSDYADLQMRTDALQERVARLDSSSQSLESSVARLRKDLALARRDRNKCLATLEEK